MPQFGLSATTDGEWAVLAVSGEVDLATGPALRERLLELADGGARHVVVDLRQVHFMDSVSLGVLVAASRRLRDAEPAGSLRLVCTNEQVIKAFVLTACCRCSRCTPRSSRPALLPTTLPARPATTATASTPRQRGCSGRGASGCRRAGTAGGRPRARTAARSAPRR